MKQCVEGQEYQGAFQAISSKEPTCQCRRSETWVWGNPGFPGLGRSPRGGQPTPVLLPGESHGQGSLAGYSPQDRKESDMTEVTEHSLGSNLILLIRHLYENHFQIFYLKFLIKWGIHKLIFILENENITKLKSPFKYYFFSFLITFLLPRYSYYQPLLWVWHTSIL